MKKLGRFLKKNKHTVIVVGCCLLLTIVVFTLKLMLFPSEARALYGDRLDGMNEVKIKDSQLSQIEESLKEKEEVEKITTSISGRILNVLITVRDDTEVNTVKSYPDVIDKGMEEDQKKYYDVQIFIQKKNDDSRFPIIAYRHQNGERYSFTKDRS